MTRLTRRSLLACVVALSIAPVLRAAALDVDISRYRDRSAAPGSVHGRAVGERTRPSLHETPLTGTAVLLVPRSAAFLRRLEQIKAHARESSTAYRDAAGEIRRERDRYERALWEAGAADLARSTLVDADGSFAFDALAPGEWLLFGWRAAPVTRRVPRDRGKDRERFALGPEFRGYDAVAVWLKEISVAGGVNEGVELTDRNVWFSGVAEFAAPSTGR